MGSSKKDSLRFLRADSAALRLGAHAHDTLRPPALPRPLTDAAGPARADKAEGPQAHGPLSESEKRLALAALRACGGFGPDEERALCSMHPGVRELRMRNSISAAWTEGGWRLALAKDSEDAPPSASFSRARHVLEELRGLESAMEALRSRLSLGRPSLKEMAEALMSEGELTESQRRFFPGPAGAAVSGKGIAGFVAWIRNLRSDEIPNAWREPAANVVSAASLIHKARFTKQPLSPDETALLARLVKDKALKSGELAYLEKEFTNDMSARPIGEEIRSLLYCAPDPLAEAAQESMEFDTLLDFLGIRRDRVSAALGGAHALSKAHSYSEPLNPENGDAMTSATIGLSGGRSFSLDAVFDGVSGQGGASIASALAKDTLEVAAICGWLRGPEDVRMALLLADIVICMEKERTGEWDMGTTAAVSYIEGDRFFGIHCGDSDWRIVRAGESVRSSKPHGFGNRIWSGLGIGPRNVHINNADYPDGARPAGGSPEAAGYRPVILEEGDYVLTLTDGIGDVLCAHELAGICSSAGDDEGLAARSIFSLADTRKDPYSQYPPPCGCMPINGKDDDMSIIVRRMGPGQK